MPSYQCYAWQGGTPGICGAFHFYSVTFPPLGIWLSAIVCGGVWFFFFFARRNGTKSHYQMCYLCGHLEIVLAENNTGILEVSYSFQIMKQLHVLLATHFQYKSPHFVEITWISHFVRQSSIRILICSIHWQQEIKSILK